MMKKNRLTVNAIIFTIALAISSTMTAQVFYKIELLEDEKTYVVSMIPEVSLQSPMNMVSTAQVSIKIPANSNFVIDNLQSSVKDVNWQASYVAESPKEAPKHEYISFGLASLGASTIPFTIGEEVELFRFENLGECPGDLSIIDNENDPFIYPNSRSVSISNGITVLGLGTQAYHGNLDLGTASCPSKLNLEVELLDLDESLVVSPNPTADYVSLSYDNPVEARNQRVLVYNITGEKVYEAKAVGTIGKHNLDINVRDWNNGSYIMQVENDKGTTRGKRFVKVSAL